MEPSAGAATMPAGPSTETTVEERFFDDASFAKRVLVDQGAAFLVGSREG